MALKLKYKTKDEVPAELQSMDIGALAPVDRHVDGVVDKSKHDEFRNANVALKKELEDQKKKFEGIDPDEVRKLADEKRQLEESQQLKLGEVEKVLENRMKNAKAEWDKQFAAVNAERESLTGRLTAIQIDQGVTTVATKKGLRPTAIPDITARARNVFRLVNGLPTGFETDGKTVRFGKDGMTPMTLEEWVDTQVADAPHLFESNSGGGAAGEGSGGTAGAGPGRANRTVKNPFKKESWNLTEQMKMQRTDPNLAGRLKAAV